MQAGAQSLGKGGWELLPQGLPPSLWKRPQDLLGRGDRRSGPCSSGLESAPSVGSPLPELQLREGLGQWSVQGPFPASAGLHFLRTCSSLTCQSFLWFVCHPHPELQKTGKDQGPRGLVFTHPVPASSAPHLTLLPSGCHG